MVGTGDHHLKRNKPGSEEQSACFLSYTGDRSKHKYKHYHIYIHIRNMLPVRGLLKATRGGRKEEENDTE
jgi:hypothetical protein